MGSDQEFYLMGVAITLGLAFVYSMGNLDVFLYYRRERRAEFNVVLHAVLPFVSTLALLWVVYKSVVPLPDPPVAYAPLLVVVWLVACAILVFALSHTGRERMGREEWMQRAGEIAFAEAEEAGVGSGTERAR